MAERYVIRGSTLTEIADKLRSLQNGEETLTPAAMSTVLGDLNEAVTEQESVIEDIIEALQGKSIDYDSSGVTALPEDVSESVMFMDANGVLRPGTMPEILDEDVVLDTNNTSFEIESGRHTGGTVQIVSETENNRFTPSSTEQTINAPSGKVFTKIILDPIPDIYVDYTGATAEDSHVLSGIKYIGKSGNLESGAIVTVSGKQGSTITSNGTKYINKGYHDGSSYMTVNVSQTINSGEDSSACTATAADVRINKTFRAGGTQKTGTMPDITLPSLEVFYDTTSSATDVTITATLPATSAGYLAARSISQSMKFIPKYTGSYSVTPGSSVQTLQTSGKYMTENITVSAVPAAEATSGYGEKIITSQTKTFTITGVIKQPNMISLCLNADYGGSYYQVHDFFYNMNSATYTMTWEDEVQKDDSISVVVLKSEHAGSNASVTYANNTITITLKSSQFFEGTYRWMWA